MRFDRDTGLWTSREARSVSLLRNGHVELVWDRVIVQLRQADLTVLHTTLRKWMTEGEREEAETYLLTLNQCSLLIEAEDLYAFCAMVEDAAEQMTRKFVRWNDLAVNIVPFTTDSPNSSAYFCFN
jgi:hypothetical protein